jgi:hypothetical protein
VYWRPAEEELTWQLYHELDVLQKKLLERARGKKKEMADMRNVERVWEFFQHPARFLVELVVRAVLPRTLSCLEHVLLRQAVDKLDVFWLLLRPVFVLLHLLHAVAAAVACSLSVDKLDVFWLLLRPYICTGASGDLYVLVPQAIYM